jgi:hypothetical protein
LLNACHAASEEPTPMWAKSNALVALQARLPTCRDCHNASRVPEHPAVANNDVPPILAVPAAPKSIVTSISALPVAFTKTRLAAKRLKAPTRVAAPATAAHRLMFLKNAPQAASLPLLAPPAATHARLVLLDTTARRMERSHQSLVNRESSPEKVQRCVRIVKQERFLQRRDLRRASLVLRARFVPRAHPSSAAAPSTHTPSLVLSSARPARDSLNPL